MQQYFGYVRVSTAKQGEKGVSLQEQKDAISRYAQRFGLEITRTYCKTLRKTIMKQAI